MGKVTLYHSPQTRSSGAVVLVEELGADVEVKILNMKAGENRQAAYLAVNPMGKVPAVVEDGALVTEQVGVFLFLADRFPEKGLAPAIGDPLRGPYLRWMAFYGSSFEPACVDRAMKREAGGQAMSPYGNYETTLKTVTDQLKRGPYILGERFTAADVLWGGALGWLTMFGIVDKTPEIAAYVERTTSRPAHAKVTARDAELVAAQAARANDRRPLDPRRGPASIPARSPSGGDGAMRTADGLVIGRTLEDFCRPDRMALVVYDMQVGIVRQMPTGAAVVAKVADILAAARRDGYRIIFMRHMSMPRRLMGAFQVRQAMAWQRRTDPAAVEPWFPRGSPAVEIVPELAPRPDEAVIEKITFSAFEGTPLAMVLRDCGLTAFAICGIATEIGIDPTVRHGTDLGLVPIVAADACGAGHEEAGARSLANLAFMGDAIMTTAVALAAAMAAGAGREGEPGGA